MDTGDIVSIGIAILGVGIVGFFLLDSPAFGSESSDSGGGIPSSGNTQVDALAQAIQVAENSPASWNNPGSLTSGLGYSTTGTGNSAGVVIFATPADGWNALYTQLNSIVSGHSAYYSLGDDWYGFAVQWTGGDNADSWAETVAGQLGQDPNDTLADYFG